jgi:hypothetical protein
VKAARLAFAAALLVSLATAAMAWAGPPPTPSNLRVLGGEGDWHPDNDLRLDWDELPNPRALAAVHYRVRDVAGTVVLAARIPFRTEIEHIHLPVPGRYRAEVWIESQLGEMGAAAEVQLLFDDDQPGAVEPLLPGGWISAGQKPLLRLTRPATSPLSGIRGYAISVDGDPRGSPCLSPTRCTVTETDLRNGTEEDSVLLENLPDGRFYVHAVAVSGAGVSSGAVGTTVLQIDATAPTVGVEGVPAGWSSGAVTIGAVASDDLSGMTGDGAGGPIAALSVDGAVPALASGNSVQAVVSGEGVHSVSAFARDAAGNLGTGEEATVRIDRTPPRIAFASSLDPADPELIEVRVADPLSGHDPSRGVVTVRPRGSRRQFTPLPTSVSTGRLLAHWDSDRAAPGQYEFRATAYDTAGNAGHGQLRVNGTAMVLPAPLKATTALDAGFGGKQLVWHRCSRRGLGRHCRREVISSFEQRPATRTVPYGHRATVGAVLTGPRGAPLAGLPVQVIETFSGAQTASRVRVVQTSADGSFATRLEPGPSRRIEFAFAGTRTLAAASARSSELAVRAGVLLRASAASAAVGGPPLVFSGTVADPTSIPAEGKSVELQFRLPGLPWTQFRTVRTDAGGRFRYPYRFSDDDSRGIRFQFRAFAPTEAGWPYEAAASTPIFVTAK